MFDPILSKIQEGLPVLGTCAGLILLAEKLSNDNNVYFGTLPVTVRRNAYGRQLGSFYTEEEIKVWGKSLWHLSVPPLWKVLDQTRKSLPKWKEIL